MQNRLSSLRRFPIILFKCSFLLLFSVSLFAQAPYDGKKFQNLQPFPEKSLWPVVKWFLTADKKPWPEQIPIEKKEHYKAPLKPGEMRVTFINHASFLIQTSAGNILTDPIYSERASPFSFMGPKRVHEPGIAFEDLPQIHWVVVSHNHYDHMDLDTLQKLNEKFHPEFLVPLKNKTYLEEKKIENIKELNWWEFTESKGLKITLVPSQHWSARGLTDRREALWGSYHFQISEQSLYFAGDTGYGPHFKMVYEKLGAPDLSLLPIGAYEPRWFMKDQHMNPDDAVLAHLDLKTAQSIGLHFGCFQLADDGPNDGIEDLNKSLDTHKVARESFITLKPGDSFSSYKK